MDYRTHWDKQVCSHRLPLPFRLYLVPLFHLSNNLEGEEGTTIKNMDGGFFIKMEKPFYLVNLKSHFHVISLC